MEQFGQVLEVAPVKNYQESIALSKKIFDLANIEQHGSQLFHDDFSHVVIVQGRSEQAENVAVTW